jgi:hypothetical protein
VSLRLSIELTLFEQKVDDIYSDLQRRRQRNAVRLRAAGRWQADLDLRGADFLHDRRPGYVVRNTETTILKPPFARRCDCIVSSYSDSPFTLMIL